MGVPTNGLLLSNAFSMYTSLIAFCILAVPFGFSGEIHLWPDTPTCEANTEAGAGGDYATAGLICVIAMVGVTRFSERWAKYFICLRQSAFFFSIMQALRRCIAVFALAYLFDEVLSNAVCVGAGLTMVGFILYVLGSQPSKSQN